MKRLIALILVVMMLTAAPAFAVLRILPDDVQERLHNLALEDYPDYQVTESWVQDFVGTEREVFRVMLAKGDEKVEAYVDISDETVLSSADYEDIVAAEADAQAENPIFTIMEATDSNTDVGLNDDVEEAGATNRGPWVAGGLVILALGGGVVLYLKKK